MEKKVLKVIKVEDLITEKVISLIDEDKGFLYQITVSENGFDQNKKSFIVKDEEKKVYINELLKEKTGYDYAQIDDAIGLEVECFIHPETNKAYLNDFIAFNKLDDFNAGDEFVGVIKEVKLSKNQLDIAISHEDKVYRLSGFRFTQKMGDDYILSPEKMTKSFKKFYDLFNINVSRETWEDRKDEIDALVGLEMDLKVRSFNDNKFIDGQIRV